MSWVLNAYTVVYAAMLIPAGGLADTHGSKRVFLLGVTLFIAASALCGLAGSVGWLIAARVLQAVGAALLTPASLSIVLAAFPQSRRARDRQPVGRGGRLRGRGRAEPRLVRRADRRLAVGLLHQPADRRDVAVVGCLPAARIGPRRRASHASTAWAWRCSSSPSARSRSPSSKPIRRAGPARSSWRTAGTGVIALVGIRRLGAQRARAARRPGAVPPPDLQRGERGHADVRHRVRDDVLRLLLLHGQRVALQPGAAGLAIAPGPLTVIPVAVLTGRLAGRFGHRPFLIGGALLYAATAALVHARPR